MSYPSFVHEQCLPSTKVTKDFILEVEEYLKKHFLDASFLEADQKEDFISIKIEDALGTEKLSSINQMSTSTFSDGTLSVDVEFDLPSRKDGVKARVRLNFSRKKLNSRIYISASMPNSRGFVLGLRDGLMRLVAQQKTWHWIAHPIPQVWGALFTLGSLAGYLIVVPAEKIGSYFYIAFGAFILIWFYIFLMGNLRPYTVFESRASDRADKIWGWFIGGIATFVVFGTLLTLLRRPLLGF